jgi:hypothetical protein
MLEESCLGLRNRLDQSSCRALTGRLGQLNPCVMVLHGPADVDALRQVHNTHTAGTALPHVSDIISYHEGKYPPNPCRRDFRPCVPIREWLLL